MPRTVCRISWRKGEPLGLAIHPSLTFLDLPREVRNQIYYDTLVASRPITVSSVTIDDPGRVQYTTETKQKIVSQKYTIEGRDPILDEITLSLLRCQSPLVSSEATVTFYEMNTFHFDGNEVWNPLYTFLKDIGDYNRDCLRKVSVAIADHYKKVYQDRYGVRISTHRSWVTALNPVHTSAYPPLSQPSSLVPRARPTLPPGHTPPIPDLPFARLIPRTEFLSRPLQYFDPAMQACFRLLGLGVSRLTLELILQAGVPGVDVKLGISVPSMALPNYTEGLRQEFSGGVMVLWNCAGRRDAVIEQIDSIQGKGWEIVETKDGVTHVDIGTPSLLSILATHLVLRRREVDRIPPPFCETCHMRWPSNSI
jgi:hypothetical protein